MARRVRAMVISSRASPRAKRKTTVAPSPYSPRSTAPRTARVIRKLMSSERSRRTPRRPRGTISTAPARIETRKRAVVTCSGQALHTPRKPSPRATPERTTATSSRRREGHRTARTPFLPAAITSRCRWPWCPSPCSGACSSPSGCAWPWCAWPSWAWVWACSSSSPTCSGARAGAGVYPWSWWWPSSSSPWSGPSGACSCSGLSSCPSSCPLAGAGAGTERGAGVGAGRAWSRWHLGHIGVATTGVPAAYCPPLIARPPCAGHAPHPVAPPAGVRGPGPAVSGGPGPGQAPHPLPRRGGRPGG